MYTAVDSTQICRVYVVPCATVKQSFCSCSEVSGQVVSDREYERIQVYICLKLPIAELYFGHSNFQLESVNEELFFFTLNIYTHFVVCISPTLSSIDLQGTGAEDPRPRPGYFVLTANSHFSFITSFFSTGQTEFHPFQYPKLLSVSK